MKELANPNDFPRYRTLKAMLMVAIRNGLPRDVRDEILRRWNKSFGAFWAAEFSEPNFETPDRFALLDRSVSL